jgi:hypothetical protein
MHKSLLLITLAFVPLLCNAGNEHFPLGGRQNGMGGCGTTLSDIWSIQHNQAGLAFLEKPGMGFYYENRFILKELGLQAGAFAYPTKSGTLGLSLSHFGYSRYNETHVGLAYAKAFGTKFSMGVQVGYLNTHFAEEYGNKGTPIAEIGFLSKPAKHLYIGAHIYNITRAKIAAYDDERVPTIIKLGIGYELSERVLCTVEAEKDIEYDPIFRAGIDYRFLDNLFLRAGFSGNPNQISFGLGYSFKRLRADVSFTTHQVLGITPHFALLYDLK